MSERGDRALTIISADDHLVEPRHLFEGRLPAHLQDRAPYVRTTSRGHEIWVFDGAKYDQVGLNAVVGLDGRSGRERTSAPMEPVRFLPLLPMTPNEAAWKRVHGAAALQERWLSRGTDLRDPLRSAVLLD